jgi:hypothetical protein
MRPQPPPHEAILDLNERQTQLNAARACFPQDAAYQKNLDAQQERINFQRATIEEAKSDARKAK